MGINKKELRESKSLLKTFTKEEFPTILSNVGKGRLKLFIFAIKKDSNLVKSTFMNKLIVDLTEASKMDEFEGIINELDRFIKKVLVQK